MTSQLLWVIFNRLFKDCFQCRTIQRTTCKSFDLQLLVLDSDTLLVVAVVDRLPTPHKDVLTDFSDFLGGIIPNFDRFLIIGVFNTHLQNTLPA